jgi:hypothetical protein
MTELPADEMSIGQLVHHPGLHVTVNLEGRTIGGALFDAEQWVPGVVIGSGGDGTFVTIKLDAPIGAGEPRRFGRTSHGHDLLSIDNPAQIRATALAEVHPGGVPTEIIELVRAGKKTEAIKRYRALNGGSLDEARAFLATL